MEIHLVYDIIVLYDETAGKEPIMKHVRCYIPEYPRPQFVRKDWLNLNGEWNFAFGDEADAEAALAGKLERKINVPFTYET